MVNSLYSYFNYLNSKHVIQKEAKMTIESSSKLSPEEIEKLEEDCM